MYSKNKYYLGFLKKKIGQGKPAFACFQTMFFKPEHPSWKAFISKKASRLETLVKKV
jgi:hypothetical protein